MATVATESCADCESLLLEHANETFECPDCRARFEPDLVQITPGVFE